jgi:hypothetical protein
MATDSIKAFLSMGFSFGKVVEALADGFQLSDLGPILGAAKSIPGGLAAAPMALAQYLQMTDEEAAPLEAWVIETFDLKDDSVEHAIETALTVVIELHSLLKFFKPKAKAV